MNRQAYYEVIQALLATPEGQEGAVLEEYGDRLDATLVEVMAEAVTVSRLSYRLETGFLAKISAIYSKIMEETRFLR